jgi:hypothetical protein
MLVYDTTSNPQRDAYLEMFNKVKGSIMFSVKSHIKQEQFEGHSKKNTKALMYLVAMSYGSILRKEIQFNQLTLEEVKTKYKYSTVLKKFWKCDIDLDKILKDYLTVNISEVECNYFEELLSLIQINSNTIWSIDETPYDLSGTFIEYNPSLYVVT